jgi:hypothetical protein
LGRTISIHSSPCGRYCPQSASTNDSSSQPYRSYRRSCFRGLLVQVNSGSIGAGLCRDGCQPYSRWTGRRVPYSHCTAAASANVTEPRIDCVARPAPTMDSLVCYEFSHEMKPGEYVVAKIGGRQRGYPGDCHSTGPNWDKNAQHYQAGRFGPARSQLGRSAALAEQVIGEVANGSANTRTQLHRAALRIAVANSHHRFLRLGS